MEKFLKTYQNVFKTSKMNVELAKYSDDFI